MDNSFLIIPAVTGPIIAIFGFVLLNFPPKKINGLYGYRTPTSMKSQTRWDFAQSYAGREMIKLGGFLTLTSVLGLFINATDYVQIFIGL